MAVVEVTGMISSAGPVNPDVILPHIQDAVTTQIGLSAWGPQGSGGYPSVVVPPELGCPSSIQGHVMPPGLGLPLTIQR